METEVNMVAQFVSLGMCGKRVIQVNRRLNGFYNTTHRFLIRYTNYILIYLHNKTIISSGGNKLKYYVSCTTALGNILLKIKANDEIEAGNIALLRYNVKKVNSVSSTRPKQSIYNSLSIGSHQFIY